MRPPRRAQDEIAQLKAVVQQIEGRGRNGDGGHGVKDVEKARRACAEKDAQFAADVPERSFLGRGAKVTGLSVNSTAAGRADI